MKNQGPHRSALQGELFPCKCPDVECPVHVIPHGIYAFMHCIADCSVNVLPCVAYQNEIDFTRGACWLREVQGIEPPRKAGNNNEALNVRGVSFSACARL